MTEPLGKHLLHGRAQATLRLAVFLLLSACAGHGGGTDMRADTANPASEYCLQEGGQLEIVKDKAGNEGGMCHLPDGSTRDEWELFRAEGGQ